MSTKELTDDMDKLLNLLPNNIRSIFKDDHKKIDLLEIILDLGRIPEARYSDLSISLGKEPLSRQELDSMLTRLGPFGMDNRAGIESTLHRISAIRNRRSEIIGLTCRIGRAVIGTVSMVRDLTESGESILLMGRPGVGKTTALREIARVMADELDLRVVIIDTSNEIGGDGDIPHPAIGKARRMQVARPEYQHQVMIEAVENHMPQVIVIDEIGTELEARAARTIAERGVQLIATAHGNSISNLIKNPTLSDLIGGVQCVTLGDDEARRRNSKKTILERAEEPTFSIAIEMNARNKWSVHPNVSLTVDALLRGKIPVSQTRELSKGKNIKPSLSAQTMFSNRNLPGLFKEENIHNKLPQSSVFNDSQADFEKTNNGIFAKSLNIFCCGISSDLIRKVIKENNFSVALVEDMKMADVLLSRRNYLGQNQSFRKKAKMNNVPIHIVKSNDFDQLEKSLYRLIGRHSLNKL